MGGMTMSIDDAARLIVGHDVMVYEDPLTRTKTEGRARVLRVERDANLGVWEGKPLIRAMVRFPAERRTYTRILWDAAPLAEGSER